MNIIVPSTEQRSDFLRVLDSVAGMVGLPSGADVLKTYKVSNDTLLLPQALNPNTSTYSFDPVKAVDTPVPTERKMDKNDLFAICGVGLRFSSADYASATGTLSNYGNYQLQTFPYQQVFAGTGSGKSEAACLQTIVRGTLALSVVNDQQWEMPCTELVYEEAYGESTFTPGYGGTPGQRGIFALSTIVIIDGGNNNTLTLNLAPGDKTIIDGSFTGSTRRNLIVPVLYGIRIKNVAAGGYSPDKCRV